MKRVTSTGLALALILILAATTGTPAAAATVAPKIALNTTTNTAASVVAMTRCFRQCGYTCTMSVGGLCLGQRVYSCRRKCYQVNDHYHRPYYGGHQGQCYRKCRIYCTRYVNGQCYRRVRKCHRYCGQGRRYEWLVPARNRRYYNQGNCRRWKTYRRCFDPNCRRWKYVRKCVYWEP